MNDGGPDSLTRRSAARMEAFLASCSVALREDYHDIENVMPTAESSVVAVGAKDKKKGGGGGSGKVADGEKEVVTVTSRARTLSMNSTKAHHAYRQIDHGDLLLRLELYCRT